MFNNVLATTTSKRSVVLAKHRANATTTTTKRPVAIGKHRENATLTKTKSVQKMNALKSPAGHGSQCSGGCNVEVGK